MTYRTRTTGKPLILGERLAGGGEGEVYCVQGNPLAVVKLYNARCREASRERKLERILAKNISIKEAVKMRIALPLDIVDDSHGNFAGYVMPKIDAVPLKVALFSKSRIARYFPDLDRIGLAGFTLSFLKQVRFLHSHGMLIGDINPLNILVDRKNPERSWLIDTDSFQVDELPCPVGTDVFTPAHLQGRDFSQTLRSVEDEHFSVAIMLFMILMIGKHPYAKVGGENPAHNIRLRDFPYGKKGRDANKEVPRGMWGFIWSHFNKELKESFSGVFSEGKDIGIDAWIAVMKKYRFSLEKGYLERTLFPDGFRVYSGVDVDCGMCGRPFMVERWWYERLGTEGKKPFCAQCQQKMQAHALAKKARANRGLAGRAESAAHGSSFTRMLGRAFYS